MDDTVRDDRYRRYLLGDLPDHERDALEDACFATDEGLADLHDAEEVLIDDYEAGALSAEDRVRFETRYAQSPQGERRLRIERALKRRARGGAAESAAAARAAVPAWLPWAAGLAVVGMAAALLWSQARLRGELRQAHGRNDALERQAGAQAKRIDEQARLLDAMREDLERLRGRAEELESLAAEGGRAARVASVLLRAGLSRDVAPVPELVLPADAGLVRITLARDDGGRGFRASLQTVEGRELWSRSSLDAVPTDAGPAIRLTIPAATLRPGHHVVILSADRDPATPLAEYVFRVRRP